jgi:hypothetical protein
MEEELQVLESIYGDELFLERRPASSATVRIVCAPPDPCFVSVTLTLTLVDSQHPTYTMDAKGLGDDESRAIKLEIEALLSKSDIGEPIAFQMIELVKEKLDGLNGRATW